MTLKKENLLSGIPQGLRDPLINEYNKILGNFIEGKWEPTELEGGRIAEIIYTIVKGHTDGSFPASPSKPSNMVDACRQLERLPNTFPRSIKVLIPRVLLALYEIRNNRDVGHVGGEVNSNKMDSEYVVSSVKWLVAELIRIFHNVTTEEAREAINLIVERTIPIVWQTTSGGKRILDPTIPAKDQTLIFLYSETDPMSDSNLFNWIEYSNLSVFKKKVLGRLHTDRFVEYDQQNGLVSLSPTGAHYVEENLALELK